jgi:hypothetical protein
MVENVVKHRNITGESGGYFERNVFIGVQYLFSELLDKELVMERTGKMRNETRKKSKKRKTLLK